MTAADYGIRLKRRRVAVQQSEREMSGGMVGEMSGSRLVSARLARCPSPDKEYYRSAVNLLQHGHDVSD